MQTQFLEYQRKNRHHMPAPEAILWQKIREEQLGVKFRRQYEYGNRLFDFYSPMTRLGIEIDGESHFANALVRKRELDDDRRLLDQGIMILRFTNREVMENLQGVLEKVIEAIALRSQIPPPPSPLLRRVEKPLTVSFMLLGFLLIPFSVHAAIISTVSDPQPAAVGKPMAVHVVLNTEDEDVNALEGRLTWSVDDFTFTGARTGGSVVTFWVDEPLHPSCAEGVCSLAWSGVIPGGFSGRSGSVFTIEGTAARVGTIGFGVLDVRALRNDGRGTPVIMKIKSPDAVVGEAGEAPRPSLGFQLALAADKNPPNAFTPLIARNAVIYNGEWFVSFVARDRESGLDHYEVSENGGEFARAENPYRIKDQSLRSTVLVRAVDRAGNIREAVAVHREPGAPFVLATWGPVFIAGLIIIASAAWVVHRRLARQ